MSRFDELSALRKIFAAREDVADADVMHAAAIVGTDPVKVETFLTELSHSRKQARDSRTGNWQLMDTAPKDGTRILLYRENAHFGLVVIVGYWKSDRGEPFWCHDAMGQLGITEARKFQPSCWMALPKTPAPTSVDSHSVDDLNRVGRLKFFGRHWPKPGSG